VKRKANAARNATARGHGVNDTYRLCHREAKSKYS
jgi:hypothetical protein